MSVEWVIYYTDGSRVTSEMCEPRETPNDGVAVVLVRDGRCGRRVLYEGDYYLWSPTLGMWTKQIDAAGALMRACIAEPWCVIRRGEYQREAAFERILIAAHNDPDLPPVSPSAPPHPAWRE